jgi:hypothetical protein
MQMKHLLRRPVGDSEGLAFRRPHRATPTFSVRQ